jgi:hypothetical protein
MVKNIMGQIQAKKNRDTLIMAFVVASCILFLIWWVW